MDSPAGATSGRAWRALGVVAAVAFLGLVGARACRPGGEKAREARIGEAAPDLRLRTLDGATWSLSGERGRVVVLNVWATWCPPCLVEMPSLQALADAEAASGLRVVTICVDERVEDVRATVERLRLRLPVALDPGGAVAAHWGTVKFPETWIIDGSGIVRDRVIGARDWAAPSVRASLARLGGG